MNRRWTTLAAMLALLLVIRTVSAAGDATVSFSPLVSTAVVGDPIAIDVTVANLDVDPGLAAYDLTLHVDPSILRIDGFVDAGFVTSGQNIVICSPANIDQAAGTAHVGCTAVPLFGAPGVSTVDPVVLLHASLTPISVAASASLTIDGSLSGPSGSPISAVFEAGSVHVTGQPPAATSTATNGTTASVTPSATPVTLTTPSVSASATFATPTTSPAATLTPTSTALKPPATGNGGESAGSRNLTAALVAGIVVLTAFAAILLVWRLRRKIHT